MIVKDLIKQLKKYHSNSEVVIQRVDYNYLVPIKEITCFKDYQGKDNIVLNHLIDIKMP